MDIIGSMNTFNKVGKYLLLTLFVVNLVSMTSASGGGASGNIHNALSNLCTVSQMFLGAAVMLLIVLAGVTYAIGQVLGAETRARATVWATAMLTGALIGAIIYIITPMIIGSLLAGTSAKTGANGNPCNF